MGGEQANPTVAAQLFAIVSNILPSVTLIMLNKSVVSHYGFDFMMTLTALHMAVLWLTMVTCSAFGMFQAKPIDTFNWLLLGFSGFGSIGFMNLNLAFNSVGFYQLSKLACIPCTVFFQTVWWKSKFDAKIQLSLVVLLAGIGYATVHDVHFNSVGAFFAVLSVVSTTLYQIWIGEKQKELEMSQFQVLRSVAPLMGTISAFSALTFETGTTSRDVNVLTYEWPLGAVVMIGLSCLAAVGVNLSTYILIRKTSAVTYLVVGHVKTLIILSSDVIIFNNKMKPENALGMSVAFLGVCLYSLFKHQAAQKAKRS